MPKKLKKADLVTALASSLTDEQWSLISQLRGQPTPKARGGKENLLNGLFRRTISRARAKNKARELQQWLEGKIGDLLGEPHGKDTGICSRESSQSGPDVALSPRIRFLFPWTSECKSGDYWDLPGAIRQCQANLYPGTNWLVVLDRPHPRKGERIPPVAALDGERFFEILKELQYWKNHCPNR